MDLTTEKGVAKLMESSHTQKEWHENYDKVVAANNGLPAFWFKTIVLSGVLSSTYRQFDKK